MPSKTYEKKLSSNSAVHVPGHDSEHATRWHWHLVNKHICTFPHCQNGTYPALISSSGIGKKLQGKYGWWQQSSHWISSLCTSHWNVSTFSTFVIFQWCSASLEAYVSLETPYITFFITLLLYVWQIMSKVSAADLPKFDSEFDVHSWSSLQSIMKL